jgi:hypothetical protein
LACYEAIVADFNFYQDVPSSVPTEEIQLAIAKGRAFVLCTEAVFPLILYAVGKPGHRIAELRQFLILYIDLSRARIPSVGHEHLGDVDPLITLTDIDCMNPTCPAPKAGRHHCS